MDEAQIYARLAQVFEDVFDEDSIEVTPELSAKDVSTAASAMIARTPIRYLRRCFRFFLRSETKVVDCITLSDDLFAHILLEHFRNFYLSVFCLVIF